jgi:DNA-binding transcriptional LysR family regulator
MNWDDLRIARAVYRTGSFAAASKQLRVNETTVARRLVRLQQELGFELFEAVDGARRPTARCGDLMALAETMAVQAEQIERIGETKIGPVGRRRIATTDSIAIEVLAPRAADLLGRHRGLTIDFLASTANVNFSRWEADLAVRLQKPEKGDFAIAKLADLSFHMFEPLSGGRGDLVCAYPEDLDRTPESGFLTDAGLKPRVRCTSKNLLVIRELIKSRRCTGILPNFMCADLLEDDGYKVTRLPVTRGVWLLIQSHLQRDELTRAVIDWIRACFAEFADTTAPP